MRIIRGSSKGKKLLSVPGWDTRPTSDRIKESIFNILPEIESETMVLDLFAGTGALALEALSRGANYAVLLDKAPNAVKVINQNLKACRLTGRAEVIAWDIGMNLNCLARFKLNFNLVFMDPPYGRNAIAPTLKNLVQPNILADNATIVIEHSIAEPLHNLPLQISVKDERKYGKTLVSFLGYML